MASFENSSPSAKPQFVISLDFELYWGVHDKRSLESVQRNMQGAREAIPRMLSLFKQHDIHATWATVGFLFCSSHADLLEASPTVLPTYTDAHRSPYDHAQHIGANEESDCYHYAPSLIRMIQQTPGQEIATHTFSHYYCLEEGQDAEAFAADIQAAMAVAERDGYTIRSIVFPRNQVQQHYLDICASFGIKVYRDTEQSFLYSARNERQNSAVFSALRLLDSYINLSGHHAHALDTLATSPLVNIPSSRFLRPYYPKLSLLEPLKIRRICKGMEYAARHGRLYHLWWHPHNFGKHTDIMMCQLEKIVQHFSGLRERYGMQSVSMKECADHIR